MGVPRRGQGLGIGTIIILGLVGWALGIDPRILIGGAEMMTGGGRRLRTTRRPAERPPHRRDGPLRGRDPRQHGRRVEDGSAPAGQPRIPPAQARPLLRCNAVGMRRRAIGDGAVLLPARPDGLHRSLLLPGHCTAPVPPRASTSPMRTCWPTRSATTSRTSLGILARVVQRQQEVGDTERNPALRPRRTDGRCLAGVWAHHSQQRYKSLEQGDIEEAVAAAEAIGDDRLQRQSGGRVVPDSFTHGSSAQRVRWFTPGAEKGRFRGLRRVPQLLLTNPHRAPSSWSHDTGTPPKSAEAMTE